MVSESCDVLHESVSKVSARTITNLAYWECKIGMDAADPFDRFGKPHNDSLHHPSEHEGLKKLILSSDFPLAQYLLIEFQQFRP
jgi:hypothetical protein